MSKSKGNILNPVEIINKYGIDSLRYYLIKEVSFGNDGTISQEKLESCINSDLANNYGNLCSRVFSYVNKNCANKVYKTEMFSEQDKELLASVKSKIDNLRQLMKEQNLNKGVRESRGFGRPLGLQLKLVGKSAVDEDDIQDYSGNNADRRADRTLMSTVDFGNGQRSDNSQCPEYRDQADRFPQATE